MELKAIALRKDTITYQIVIKFLVFFLPESLRYYEFGIGRCENLSKEVSFL